MSDAKWFIRRCLSCKAITLVRGGLCEDCEKARNLASEGAHQQLKIVNKYNDIWNCPTCKKTACGPIFSCVVWIKGDKDSQEWAVKLICEHVRLCSESPTLARNRLITEVAKGL